MTLMLGRGSVETARGNRYIDSAEIKVGGIDATLFSITEKKVDADNLLEHSEEGAADRAIAPEVARLLETYPEESWLVHNSERGEMVMPFVPLESYLDNPQRVDSMKIEIDHQPFEINPAIQGFKDKLISEQLKSGRRITDGATTAVSEFDTENNILRLRKVGYFDTFVTQNFGSDIEFEEPIEANGRTGLTIRELAGGDGRLPEIGKNSLTTNSFGLGSVLKTSDGKMLLCRRKGNLGVGSASGTFGFSAAGNLAWGDTLREAIGTQPAHVALASLGIGKEAHEELGLGTRFKDPGALMEGSIASVAEREFNLEPEECSVTPIGIIRDALHMGHPQAVYYLETKLQSHEVIERMLNSEDARKEYDMVLAVDTDLDNLDRIIHNDAVDAGVNFNIETRATLAFLLSQDKGHELLTK